MGHAKVVTKVPDREYVVTLKPNALSPRRFCANIRLDHLLDEHKDQGARTQNHYFWCELVAMVLNEIPKEKTAALRLDALRSLTHETLEKLIGSKVGAIKEIAVTPLMAVPRTRLKQRGEIGRPEDGGPLKLYGHETYYYQAPKTLSKDDFDKFDRYEIRIEKNSPKRDVKAALWKFLKTLPPSQRKNRVIDLEDVRIDLIILKARAKFSDKQSDEAKAKTLLTPLGIRWPLDKKSIIPRQRRINRILKAAVAEVEAKIHAVTTWDENPHSYLEK